MREAHFSHNKIHFRAAKPREHAAREGEDSENQARSENSRLLASSQSMYCFCHCPSFVSKVYYRCVYKHTVSVGGYCMAQKYRKKSLLLPIHTILTLVMVGLLASACALGGSSGNTTSATSTPSARPSNSHPVAGQPVATGKLPPGQPLPGNEIKQLVFDLVYNDAAMERDVTALYTPNSPAYHQFLTPDQVVQRYGPSAAQQQTVENWLTQNGYTIVTVDPMHTSIKVQATVATIERSLNIKLQAFSLAGHEFFMQQGVPVLPAPVAALVP